MPHHHNNIILPERKLILMLLPKNGTTSIKASLLETYGYPVPDQREILPGTELSLLHNHPKFHFVTNQEIQNGLEDYTILTVVRNPFERVESVYVDKANIFEEVSEVIPWETHVTAICRRIDAHCDIHVRSQWYQLQWEAHLLPNMVIHLHQLKDFWPAFAERFDLAPLPVLNVTADENGDRYDRLDRKVSVEWTPELREMMRKRYYTDFLCWDFNWDFQNVQTSDG